MRFQLLTGRLETATHDVHVYTIG